jgi:hypothetical protein
VDGAISRLKPEKPEPFHFQCGMVTLRRIEVDAHAVIYNESQVQIDQYSKSHGAKYMEPIKIPIIDMGPGEFLPPEVGASEKQWHGISKKMLKQRVKGRVKEAVKSLVRAADIAKIASAVAGHKLGSFRRV